MGSEYSCGRDQKAILFKAAKRYMFYLAYGEVVTAPSLLEFEKHLDCSLSHVV